MIKWHYFRAGSQDGQQVYARVTQTGIEQPYIPYRMAQQDAKRSGPYKAVFHETETEARQALFKELDQSN